MSDKQAPKPAAPKAAAPKPAASKAPPAPHVVRPVAEASGSNDCKFEECKKKMEKFGFCMEHYELYMGGVIRGDGKKPLDFADKMARHLQKSQQKNRKVA